MEVGNNKFQSDKYKCKPEPKLCRPITKIGTRESAEMYLIGDSRLARGEIFFEVPDTGAGTGKGKIKMGDGIHDYSDLPYFIE